MSFIEASCMRLLILCHSELDFILLITPKVIFLRFLMVLGSGNENLSSTGGRGLLLKVLLEFAAPSFCWIKAKLRWQCSKAPPLKAQGSIIGALGCWSQWSQTWRPEKEHSAEIAARMALGFGWSGECLIHSTQGHKVQINFLDCFPANEKCLGVDTKLFHLGWLKYCFY